MARKRKTLNDEVAGVTKRPKENNTATALPIATATALASSTPPEHVVSPKVPVTTGLVMDIVAFKEPTKLSVPLPSKGKETIKPPAVTKSPDKQKPPLTKKNGTKSSPNNNKIPEKGSMSNTRMSQKADDKPKRSQSKSKNESKKTTDKAGAAAAVGTNKSKGKTPKKANAGKTIKKTRQIKTTSSAVATTATPRVKRKKEGLSDDNKAGNGKATNVQKKRRKRTNAKATTSKTSDGINKDTTPKKPSALAIILAQRASKTANTNATSSGSNTPPMEAAKKALNQVEYALMSVRSDLEAASKILEQHKCAYPYSTLTHNIALSNNNPDGSTNNSDNRNPASEVAPPLTTGGFLNTNHEVVLTGDPAIDRLNELKRNYEQRQRQQNPEIKLLDRWDKPRLPGQRRRRIVREVDMNPHAPHDPPPSGFVTFVGQMTCKHRHDNPDRLHHQPTVMQDISRVWKDNMSASDRQYYLDFAKEAQKEFKEQQMEYRATGFCTTSRSFHRLGGDGPWVRSDPQYQNGLEREISAYDHVHFPLRPAAHNEDYTIREWRSKTSRKLKDKGILQRAGRKADEHEQQIVADAVNDAKATMLDAVPGMTFETVDHLALVNAATVTAAAKLAEYHAGQTKGAAATNNETTVTAKEF